MIYKNFEELLAMLQKSREKKVCAVASAAEEHTLQAVLQAADLGMIEPILAGPREEIQKILRAWAACRAGLKLQTVSPALQRPKGAVS